jgi:hypothetical protein
LQSKESTHPVTVEEAKVSGDSDDEFYDADKVDPSQEVQPGDSVNAEIGNMSQEETYSLKEQLECLVHGGLPMALRGEVQPVSYRQVMPIIFPFFLAHSSVSCFCDDSCGKLLLVLKLAE